MAFTQQNRTIRPPASLVWSPVTPTHAIQRAAAVIEFAEPITSFAADKMAAALRDEARRQGMVKEDPISTAMVELRPGASARTTQTEQVGVQFQDVRGNAVQQVLNATTAGIRFETSIYTRWIAFREQLLALMQTVFPIIEQNVQIGQIALDYVDFFYAVSSGPADAQLILDKKSHLIASKAFTRHGSWHSHSGWFEHEEQAVRRLINVDVSVADANGPQGVRRGITIRTFEAEQIVDSKSTDDRLSQIEPVFSCFDDLHTSLKRRLSEVLTQEARHMISLGK